jgi:hypothetical protein
MSKFEKQVKWVRAELEREVELGAEEITKVLEAQEITNPLGWVLDTNDGVVQLHVVAQGFSCGIPYPVWGHLVGTEDFLPFILDIAIQDAREDGRRFLQYELRSALGL